MSLRIAVDATCWANGRGYGRFARELVPALAESAPRHTFVCLGDAASFRAAPALPGNVERVEVEQSAAPAEAARAGGARKVSDLLRLTRATARVGARVFFSPSVYSYYPLAPGQRAVVTVHDAIVERFPGLTIPSRRGQLFWRLKLGLALRQARLVLTVSDYAAGELAAVHRLSAARIRVAPEAAAAAYRPASADEVQRAAQSVGLPEGAAWFTFVGGFSPHKRLDVVLRAHAALPEARRPYLVLVGRLTGDAFHTEVDSLRALVATLGTSDTVRWTDHQPDEVVRALHTGARATLLPSASEGFGLPAVEAAACGAPVIATTHSPLPKLLEGGGFFVAPGDVGAVREAMAALLDDAALRASMGARAREGAARLSWRRTAEATLAALEEAAA